VHFWGSLIFMNLIFLPMFSQGMGGMLRRMSDGGVNYLLRPELLYMNKIILYAAIGLALAQVPFIINFFQSIKGGRKVTSDNPWGATTLDWQTPTPPGHGNFDRPMEVFRGPYEYSVPGHKNDFTPQNESPKS
jgi:cytochrome c oxidase subunit 1